MNEIDEKSKTDIFLTWIRTIIIVPVFIAEGASTMLCSISPSKFIIYSNSGQYHLMCLIETGD